MKLKFILITTCLVLSGCSSYFMPLSGENVNLSLQQQEINNQNEQQQLQINNQNEQQQLQINNQNEQIQLQMQQMQMQQM